MKKLGFIFIICFTLKGFSYVIYDDEGSGAAANHKGKEQLKNFDEKNKFFSAIAVQVLNKYIKPNGSVSSQGSMGKYYELCEDEPWYKKDHYPGECTGFLISNDLLLTAGHCMSKFDNPDAILREDVCEHYSWVLNYQGDQISKKGKRHILRCLEILSISEEPELDYALLRVTSAPKRFSPIKIDFSTQPELKMNVFTIGAPLGSPMVLIDSASIISLPQGGEGFWNNFFYTNLDSFGGNSGSPVFAEKDNQLLGLFLTGNNDFYFDDQNMCTRVNYCTQDSRSCLDDNDYLPTEPGQGVLKISKLKDILEPYLRD